MGSLILLIDKFKTLWIVWDIRGAVLLSFFCQVFLKVFSSSRKRTWRFFVWLVYLLADWEASFAIGLIASGLSECSQKTLNDDLNAFWASFLLGHLGGPHTITSFAMEDNELWIRHILQFIIHLLAIAYVFYQSLPNQLWVPISLVYLSGLIKYGERIHALYLASLGTIKTSMIPPPMAPLMIRSDYDKFMQVYRSKTEASIPVYIIEHDAKEVEPLVYNDYNVERAREIEVVQNGWRFFNMLKGLVVDFTHGYHEWQKTRDFFFSKTAEETYRIIETELNFLYGLLHTKMLVWQSKMALLFHSVCLACVVVALERFQSYQHHLKLDIDDHDINITYTLLIGAISLDVLAFLMIIFSDWTIASLSDRPIEVLKCCKYTKLLNVFYEKLISILGRKRWSQYVSQYSLMDYCLNTRFKVMRELRDSVAVGDELKRFIFTELRNKAVRAKNSQQAKEISSWLEERVLLSAPHFYTSLVEGVQVEYDEIVLRWHVATKLLYYTTSDEDYGSEHRQYCKIISQYMLYLMIMRPTMMSTVTSIVQFRFQDTCDVTKRFFRSAEGSMTSERAKNPTTKIHHGFTKKLKEVYGKAKNFLCQPKEDKALMEACKKLFEIDTIVDLNEVKGNINRSVLFHALIMAKELKNKAAEERWKVMSSVWVELLSYAASKCRAYAHAQQLSKGGEFITLVWLLMIHFGLGESYRVAPETNPETSYKLVVAK